MMYLHLYGFRLGLHAINACLLIFFQTSFNYVLSWGYPEATHTAALT